MIDRSPSTLTAADVMSVSPRTCSVFSSVLEAVLIFRDADCGAVPVVQGGLPVGIVTDRDVALALASYPDLANRPMGEIMTKGTITVAPDAPLEEIRAMFSKHDVHRLLVVDTAGQLLGIVARTDLAPLGADVRLDRGADESVPCA